MSRRGTQRNDHQCGQRNRNSESICPGIGAYVWKNVEGCIKTETLEGGTLEVHAISGTDNGAVTVTGFRITISILGSSCVYGFGENENLGTLTGNGSGNAVLDISTNFLKKEGGIACPSDLNWAEEFTHEKPVGTALYVLSS